MDIIPQIQPVPSLTADPNSTASPTEGVLLDLRCNNRRNQVASKSNYPHSSAAQHDMIWTTTGSPNQSQQPKREVLLKIRQKILEKRNAQHYRRLADDDGFMWRPW